MKNKILLACPFIAYLYPNIMEYLKIKFPFECNSSYFKDSTIFVNGNESLYSIDIYSQDISTLKKLHTILDKNWILEEILYIDQDEIFVSFIDSCYEDITTGFYFSGIAKINTKKGTEEILYIRQNKVVEKDKYHWWKFHYSFQDNQFLITEKYKLKGDLKVIFHSLSLNGKIQYTIIPDENFHFDGSVAIKTISKLKYLFWINDFTLYRWQIQE